MPGVLIARNAAVPHSGTHRRLQMPIFVQIHIRDLACHRAPLWRLRRCEGTSINAGKRY